VRSSIAEELKGLNPQQLEAVTCTEGPLLVVAGAGSGKTKTLTVRLAYLITEKGVPPSSILAVTFTNKAAKEMKERVEGLVEFCEEKPTVTTFHSFCCSLLRRWSKLAGFEDGFTIYDETDSKKLIKDVLKELKINTKTFSPAQLSEQISKAKNELLLPDDLIGLHEIGFTKRDTECYALYQKKLEQNAAADFDDLIFKVYLMLKRHPELLARLQDIYRYFMVDEYQDTNKAQYELIAMLSAKTRNLCVVGDEDQSIYSWRGATIRNIRNFAEDFPGTKVIKLEQNYRSAQNILDAAGSLIANNKSVHSKHLWSEIKESQPIVFKRLPDDREEAVWVVRTIEELHAEGQSWDDFCVLFRMNSLSRPVEQILKRLNIPYEMAGGTKYFERREVKDILAYLRIIDNPLDSVSIERIINVPRRGIGKTTLEKLIDNDPDTSLWEKILMEASENPSSKIAGFLEMIMGFIEYSEQASVSDLCRKIIAETDYFEYLKKNDQETAEERKQNVQALVSDIRYQEQDADEEGLSLRSYLESVALHSDLDEIKDEGDKVRLMTLHNAKGLEFTNVFMIAMEEDIFPHSRSKDEKDDLEEERRLAYVGITRAKKGLYMSSADRRMMFGNWKGNPVSRFVTEIPTHIFQEGAFSRETSFTKRDFSSSSSSNFSGQQASNFFKTQAQTSIQKPKYTFAKFRQNPQQKEKDETFALTTGMASGNMVNLIPGAEVFHNIFGEGTVQSVSGETLDDFRVTVNFEGKGLKTLLLQYTTLKVKNT